MRTVEVQSAQVDVSVIVPVYNSAATLPELVDRLLAVFAESGHSYEIILIDDGSVDDSWVTLKTLQSEHPAHLIVIELMRNFGQHNAIMCGFKECSGKYVVTLDDDLQNPPEEIPWLISCLQKNDLDLVYGMCVEKKHHMMRNVGSRLTQSFYRVVFRRKNGVSAFRVITQELVACVVSYNKNYIYLDGLFAWNSSRIADVRVRHDARLVGQSGYSVRKLIVLATNLFTNFTLAPLQFVSLVGFTTAAVGFGAAGYYAYAKLVNDIAVPGFASLIIAITCFSGIQLLSLGVMGEYLGRLHLNSNQQPQYVKRTVIDKRSEKVASVPNLTAVG